MRRDLLNTTSLHLPDPPPAERVIWNDMLMTADGTLLEMKTATSADQILQGIQRTLEQFAMYQHQLDRIAGLRPTLSLTWKGRWE